MLLYPGKPINKKFVAYQKNEHDQTDHECKLSKVSVIKDDGSINDQIAEHILEQLEIY